MSVEHLAVVLNHSQATGTAKVVLIGIANHAGDDGAFPSVRTLMRYANVNDRNLRAALRRLEELGELEVETKAGGSDRMPDHVRPNRYHVLVSCPPWCDRSSSHRDVRQIDVPLSQATGGWGRLRQGAPVATDRTPLSVATGQEPSVEPSVEPSDEPLWSSQAQIVTFPGREHGDDWAWS